MEDRLWVKYLPGTAKNYKSDDSLKLPITDEIKLNH